jgi:alpha-1,6-mannosyltransferase
VRIVRVANFVTARSGGLRTALRQLGAGYQRAGHEAVLVVPGATPGEVQTEQGRVITMAGPPVPGMGGYRVLLDRRRTAGMLERLEPDRIEVSDRTTLRWVGAWARRNKVPSMMVSHESLDGLLRLVGPVGTRWMADRINARTAAAYDTIVCTTGWAAAEFERIGAGNLLRVPLGVDLEWFSPDRRDPVMRRRWAADGDVLVVHCGRLSTEKRPRRSLEAVALLRTAGVPAVLAVAGGGPLRSAMQEEAAARGLPVRFLGHVSDRAELAALLATADVAIAPGPVETFGLAALEALASGTPVVVSVDSALPEVIGAAGVAAAGDGRGYAAGVRSLLSRPDAERRAEARRQAERYPWSAAIAGFLAAHGVDGAAGSALSPPEALSRCDPVVGGERGQANSASLDSSGRSGASVAGGDDTAGRWPAARS